MAEEVEQPKKKVYVETTVVSDATALPARDVVQLGRQVVTREWWDTAAQRFDLYSSPVVAKEIRREFQAYYKWTYDTYSREDLQGGGLCVPMYLYTANASGGRSGMTVETRYDEGLEEIWRIKREIGAEYPTWEAFAAGILAFQEEERRRGVKFVRFPPRKPESAMA